MLTPEDSKNAPESTRMRIPHTRRKPKPRTKCTCPYCMDGERVASSGKKIHICHYKNCGKVFLKSSHLGGHLLSHTGEKPHLCDVGSCGKRFRRSDELLRHKRIHFGIKFHKCPECTKGFLRSDHLAKYLKTHARKKQMNRKKVTEMDSDESEEEVVIKKNYQSFDKEKQKQFLEIVAWVKNSEEKSSSLVIPRKKRC